MRKLRSLQHLCLLLCLLYGIAYESNAQVTCGNLDTLYDPPGNLQLRGPNADCNRQSDIFDSYFRHKENFIPWENSSEAPHMAKKVKVRFLIGVPPGTTKLNYDHNDLDDLYTLVE